MFSFCRDVATEARRLLQGPSFCSSFHLTFPREAWAVSFICLILAFVVSSASAGFVGRGKAFVLLGVIYPSPCYQVPASTGLLFELSHWFGIVFKNLSRYLA